MFKRKSKNKFPSYNSSPRNTPSPLSTNQSEFQEKNIKCQGTKKIIESRKGRNSAIKKMKIETFSR